MTVKLNQNQIKKLVKAIDSSVNFEAEDFEVVIKNFLIENIECGMKVTFYERQNEFPFEMNEINALFESFTIIEDAPKSFLREAIRCYDSYSNDLYDVPIINIDTPKIIEEIAKERLSEEEIEEILFPEKKVADKFNDIELSSGYNLAYEVEGGFNRCGFKEILKGYGFNVVGDSSVSVNARYSSQEIVVDGYHTGQEVLNPTFKLMNYLEEEEFVYNDSCGIHIHTSPPDDQNWKMVDVIKFSRFYCKVEKYIYKFLPEERKKSKYSKPIGKCNIQFKKAIMSMPVPFIENLSELENQTVKKLLGSMWYQAKKIGRRTGNKYDNSRYVGFNLHSVFYRNTLEFRQFDGNYELLPHFIDFVDKFIYYVNSKSIEELDVSAKGIKSTAQLLNCLGVANSTKEKLLNRVEEAQQAA